MVVRLGKFCGNDPELWSRMQMAHDLWAAEQALSAEIEKIPTYQAAALGGCGAGHRQPHSYSLGLSGFGFHGTSGLQ